MQERLVRGLNGRPLALTPAGRCYTATETLCLPPLLARLPDKAANVRLYKAMAVHQRAQNWYGTCCYRGELAPTAVRERLDIRKALERERLRIALLRLMDEADDSERTGADQAEGAFLYHERDFGRRHHRNAWCALRERALSAGDLIFYRTTLDKYGGLIKSIRRAFGVLRGEDGAFRCQPHGEDIDINALVEAHAGAHAGREMTQRRFLRQHNDERSMAVMLMVDMSRSSKGWTNQAEREALALRSVALTVLGDGFAIDGFSGWTRKRCEVFPVKRFAEPCYDALNPRIGSIQPKGSTRMGAPIRHLSGLLRQQTARTRLLITLADGKPDEYDLLYPGD